jgi:hypothetical protein
MKTGMLKTLMTQYPDGSILFVRISRGIANRLGGGIESSKFDGDLFEIKGIERHEKTGSPVLLLEVMK